jgi:hypothetical protein
MSELASLHVAARRALLDALDAAAPFRQSLIIVGAQAIYLRTTDSVLALAPYTTDGDIAIDPSTLPTTPALETTLGAAGFSRSQQPGSWTKSMLVDERPINVDVDFLVPEAVAGGSGKRSVLLDGHDRMAARRVYGLEAALVDHSEMLIAAIDAADSRALVVKVAGAAALFIAKIHKIADRIGSGRYQRTPVDKDAADVYRLVQSTSVGVMASGFRLAISKDVSHAVAELALSRADQLFGRPTAAGVQMAVRAVGVAGEAPETIAALLAAYSAALLAEIQAVSAGPT